MTIGINATAAVTWPRTGVEEYVYQLIKHLTMLPEAMGHRFLLFVPKIKPDIAKKLFLNETNNCFDFSLPENFAVKQLKWPWPMWTQIRLASQMLLKQPDVLFAPAHVLPMAHPKNSIVSVLGLEYEYYPEVYSFFRRRYLRFATKYAVKKAKKIIAISDSTKRDLVKLYGDALAEKIRVVQLGISLNQKINRDKETVTENSANEPPAPFNRDCRAPSLTKDRNYRCKTTIPYLLYLGRLETKKNVQGIIEAYKILKEKYRIPHELVLAGSPGFGYKSLKLRIRNCRFKINEPGYVSEAEKQRLLREAEIFLFPSFYEGFGLPILEAQAAGVSVVTANISSMPEVAGEGAVLVDPKKPEEIARAVYKIIDDRFFRDKLIKLGYENVKRFSWEKCARETLRVLTEEI